RCRDRSRLSLPAGDRNGTARSDSPGAARVAPRRLKSPAGDPTPVFRIHKIFDVTTPANQRLLSQVQAMLRVQFEALSEQEIETLPARLRHPHRYRFRPILLVAEKGPSVRGFALLLHDPELAFCLLDYVAAAKGRTGGGIGGALYERAR